MSPNSSINRDWQSANVFSMGNFHIVLIYHCVLHCGVNFGMAEEPLHLFYRHSFVDGACRQRSSELMWMHLCDTELPSQLSQSYFHSTDLQPVVWTE